jgi:hypothetical protein
MSDAITLEQARAHLSAYLAAELAVLQGQRYEIAGRMLQRADLAEIRLGIGAWTTKVNELSGRASGRSRVRVLSPRF